MEEQLMREAQGNHELADCELPVARSVFQFFLDKSRNRTRLNETNAANLFVMNQIGCVIAS